MSARSVIPSRVVIATLVSILTLYFSLAYTLAPKAWAASITKTHEWCNRMMCAPQELVIQKKTDARTPSMSEPMIHTLWRRQKHRPSPWLHANRLNATASRRIESYPSASIQQLDLDRSS